MLRSYLFNRQKATVLGSKNILHILQPYRFISIPPDHDGGLLTQDQMKLYETDGYIIIRKLLSEEDINL